MDLRTISATLALLGSGLPLALGCDGPKEVDGPSAVKSPAKGSENAAEAPDAKAAKGEMKCAPGACGAEMEASADKAAADKEPTP